MLNLATVPKSLLHVHWEGSVQKRTLTAIARRKGIAPPREDVYAFEDFDGFNRIFPEIFRPLTEEEDFEEITTAFLSDLNADHVVDCEAFFVPLAHVRRGVPFEKFFPPLLAALEEGERRLGVRVRLIASILRAGGNTDWGMQTLDLCERHPHERLVGVDLSGPESLETIKPFAAVFDRARSLGLRTTAHAGEFCGAEHVRQTLEILKPDRIGHGIGIAEDESLVAEIVRRDIPLEICPGSNLRLKAVRSIAEHPIRRLFDAGVPMVIGTDDPAFFGNTLSGEYELLRSELGFDDREIEKLIRSSFEYGWGARGTGFRLQASGFSS